MWEKNNPGKTRSSWNTTVSGLKRTRGLRMSSLGERETVELAKNSPLGRRIAFQTQWKPFQTSWNTRWNVFNNRFQGHHFRPPTKFPGKWNIFTDSTIPRGGREPSSPLLSFLPRLSVDPRVSRKEKWKETSRLLYNDIRKF